MKRLLSLSVALCTVLPSIAMLCIALYPVPVFATDTEPSLEDAPAQSLISQNEPQDMSAEPTEHISPKPETLTPIEEALDTCNILQYVDKTLFEQANHVFRLPDLETLSTYVFQNTDGTRSIYYMNEAVKYVDSLGTVREKDLTLRGETGGYRMTANEFGLFLPLSIADGISLTHEGYEVRLAPTGGNAPASLQNNAVTYEGYFGEGTSLRYTPMLSGVKEEIILDSYIPNRSYAFALATDGLFLVERNGRYVLSKDTYGKETVLFLGEILVYDAVGKPSLGTLTVETVKEGLGYILTVSADEAFLSDPATVYPVTIDPDLTVQDTADTAGLVEDATIYNGTPSQNTGNWTLTNTGYVNATYGVGRTLFRLPGLYDSELFASLSASDITSVTFHCRRSSQLDTERVMLYRCTASWSESAVTWNSFANRFDSGTDWGTAVPSGWVTAFDITTLAQGWASGTYSPEYGFCLVNPDETNAACKFGACSSEYSTNSYRPYAVMTYTEPVEEVTPTISLPSISSVALDATKTLTATTTPAGATVTWGSTNPEVATVDSAGVVTGKKIGTTTIIARIADTSVFDECTLYVHLPNGVYYLNSTVTSKYLNNNNGTPNGYSAPLATVETSAAWNFIYQSPGQYHIQSCVSPGLYLADTSSETATSIGLLGISSLTYAQCLWTIEKDDGSNQFTLTSYYGRKLYSIDGITVSATATLGIATYPPHTEKWRYVHEDDMIELTDFTVNLDQIECFETTEFRVIAGGNGQSFVGTRDFSFAITSGSSYLSLATNGTMFADITGKNVGTATITVTYKVSGLAKTFEVDVIPYPFVIGMSTDNYTSGCDYDERNSYFHAETFYNMLALGSNYSKSYRWHFNNDAYVNAIGASKNDFESTIPLPGEIASQADFMLYIGHGIAADRTGILDGNRNDRTKGNFLHYNHAEDGTSHNTYAGCNNDIFNLYTSEARFEHPRWVWLYTCNFLNVNEYVTDDMLKEMMAGTHILMGYSTSCFIAPIVPETFANQLSSGEKIIESFFVAGDEGESKVTSDEHIQKVLYLTEARNETIFSAPQDYSSSTIKILENNIQTEDDWRE